MVPVAQEAEAAPAGANGRPGEPEKLRLPAEAVQYLLALTLRTDLGAAWWRGFVCAHGEPSWVVGGQWTFRARDAEVVRALPEE